MSWFTVSYFDSSKKNTNSREISLNCDANRDSASSLIIVQTNIKVIYFFQDFVSEA